MVPVEHDVHSTALALTVTICWQIGHLHWLSVSVDDSFGRLEAGRIAVIDGLQLGAGMIISSVF